MTEQNIEIVEGYVPGIIADIAKLHMDYYVPNWGFGCGFEIDIASGLADFFERYDDERNAVWTASINGKVEAAIIIDGTIDAGNEARLRYFIASDVLRGQGIGRRLMELAINFCDEQRFDRVYLKTFGELEAACHLYEAFGFVIYEEDPTGGLATRMYERFLPRG